MRKNFGAKAALYPMPVLIIAAYDENGIPNAMNAAWGGISEMNEISVCISADHKTTKNILATKALTISMATVDQMAACDFVGLVSGNKGPDKLAKAGLHTTKSEFVNAPLIDELPMALECELINYDMEKEYMTAKIVNICVDESVLTDGKVDIAKLRPITYDGLHHGYYVLGEKVGNAYQEGTALKESL